MAEENRWTQLNPNLVAPEVSNRLLRPFLDYIEQVHGVESLENVVEGAGLPRAYIDDHEYWVSASYIDGFTRTWAKQHFGLHELPGWGHPVYQLWYQVGRQALNRDSLGAAYSVLRALGSPGAVYGRLPQLVRSGNRLLRLDYERISEGHARLDMRATDDALATYDVPATACWNIIGMLEAIPDIWGLPQARVTVSACRHQDPTLDHCSYDVHYVDRSLSSPLILLGGTLLAATIGSTFAGSWAGPAAGVLGGLVGALGVIAVMGWWRAHSLQSAQLDDAPRIESILTRNDDRLTQLFAESHALRRALLASRKLSGYLASDLVERIVQDPELELTLGGRRTQAAVLFADIVGFTPRCEPLPPEQVVDELNLYFAHVDPAFRTHGGIIDKRMGDGIMAVFVPIGKESAASMHARAVGCGLDMLRALTRCNGALAEQGAAPMQIRVGVAAGPLVQGNMGSDVKLEYTVVGDTVNLAARLEAAATPGHLLVSATSLPEMSPETGGFSEVSRNTIRVKGKSQAVEVVELRPEPRHELDGQP
jgi:class 3 adenylate cyclase